MASPPATRFAQLAPSVPSARLKSSAANRGVAVGVGVGVGVGVAVGVAVGVGVSVGVGVGVGVNVAVAVGVGVTLAVAVAVAEAVGVGVGEAVGGVGRALKIPFTARVKSSMIPEPVYPVRSAVEVRTV